MTTPSERERAEFKKLPKREPHIILPNYFCPTCGAGSDTPIVLDSEEAEAARREERERCAGIAGGWTGPINTVDNCAVVSEVCRSISKAIRALDKEG